MIDRLQTEQIHDSKKSILLLGPRQVGKSTLIRSLGVDLEVNLANERTYLNFASQPGLLESMLANKKIRTVFIDEVQRIPSILNTIQSLIDVDKKLKFYLSGSSARKLKRGGANLLPGRVINHSLGPIIARELNYEFKMSDVLRYGFLPEILSLKNESEKKEILLSYSANYIREEIQAEALTKSVESFSRFLNEVSHNAGLFIDYTKISKNAMISRHTCPNFFEILEDTMIGYRIYPDQELLESADLVKHPKFYFFDVGVFNALEGSFDLSSRRKGVMMEHLIFQQIFHSARALKKDLKLNTFRTRAGLEVDFILQLEGQRIAVEVKASDRIDEADTEALLSLNRYLPKCEKFIFYDGPRAIKVKNVWAFPAAEGLKKIGL